MGMGKGEEDTSRLVKKNRRSGSMGILEGRNEISQRARLGLGAMLN
jgi:hypothetical protein